MLEDAGAVLAGTLPAWKARVLLMVALTSGVAAGPKLVRYLAEAGPGAGLTWPLAPLAAPASP